VSNKYKIKSRVQSGVPTPNGNIYPPGLLQAAFAKAVTSPQGLLGTLGQSGKGLRLEDVSHKVIGFKESGSGEIEVEVEVLDTPAGRKLKELLEGGGFVRAIPKGEGETKPEGKHRVVTSYSMESFDVTLQPSGVPEECSCECHKGVAIYCSCFAPCCSKPYKLVEAIKEPGPDEDDWKMGR
jgi:hypothetical protein